MPAPSKLQKQVFFLKSQIATVDQTAKIAAAMLGGMLTTEEDTAKPAGLRQVGRSAITVIRDNVAAQLADTKAKLRPFVEKAEANLELVDTDPQVDILDAQITGGAIAHMGGVVNAGALVFKALEHLPKLNNKAPDALVAKIVAAFA